MVIFRSAPLLAELLRKNVWVAHARSMHTENDSPRQVCISYFRPRQVFSFPTQCLTHRAPADLTRTARRISKPSASLCRMVVTGPVPGAKAAVLTKSSVPSAVPSQKYRIWQRSISLWIRSHYFASASSPSLDCGPGAVTGSHPL
jgi:hypothetical protein